MSSDHEKTLQLVAINGGSQKQQACEQEKNVQPF